MPNIFNYLNYREYLHDYYQEKKRSNVHFSYQIIANKAGFKSRSFFLHVVDGKRNLSEKSTIALGKALGMTPKEFVFFELLVGYNQARSHSQKESFFSQMAELRPSTKSHLMLLNSHEYYSHWYHSTIRELITIIDFKDDFSLLAKFIKPKIPVRQIRQSVHLLLKLGLVKKKPDGSYIQTDANITTGDTVESISVENFHLQNLNLAGEAIDSCPAQDRELSCMVVGLSVNGFEQIKEEMRKFRKKLVKIINSDDTAERVYHIGMQLFPTSESQKISGGVE